MDISTTAQCDVQHAVESKAPSEKRNANLRMFQKGVSGNPGGKSKVLGEIQTLARSKSKRAFERIVELVEDEDSRVALMAAKEVLDRAYGKAKPAEDEGSDKKSVTINIVKYDHVEDYAGSHPSKQLAAPTVSVRTLALS